MKLKQQLWNVLFFLLGILLVLGIMYIPYTYYKKDDEKKYITRTYMEPITYGLSTDIRNIVAVREIHQLLKSPYQVAVEEEGTLAKGENGTAEKNPDEDKIEQVIKKRDEDELVMTYDKELMKAVEVLQKPLNYSKKEYEKQMLWSNGEKVARERMEEYLKYLNMDVIDDWHFTILIDGSYEYYDIQEDQEMLYNEYIAIRDGKEKTIEWVMSSESAHLKLMVTPEKEGVRYYFKVLY